MASEKILFYSTGITCGEFTVGLLIYSTLNALFVIHTNHGGPSYSGFGKTGKVINLWHKSACDACVLLADYVTR